MPVALCYFAVITEVPSDQFTKQSTQIDGIGSSERTTTRCFGEAHPSICLQRSVKAKQYLIEIKLRVGT